MEGEEPLSLSAGANDGQLKEREGERERDIIRCEGVYPLTLEGRILAPPQSLFGSGERGGWGGGGVI